MSDEHKQLLLVVVSLLGTCTVAREFDDIDEALNTFETQYQDEEHGYSLFSRVYKEDTGYYWNPMLAQLPLESGRILRMG